jgi:hypothetical protein
MSKVLYKHASKVQAGNVTDLLLDTGIDAPDCTNHQLQIICTGVPSAGTVTVKCKAVGGDRWFTLKDKNGVNVSLNLTTDDTINIDGIVLDSVKITMASFATATAWVAKLRGW